MRGSNQLGFLRARHSWSPSLTACQVSIRARVGKAPLLVRARREQPSNNSQGGWVRGSSQLGCLRERHSWSPSQNSHNDNSHSMLRQSRDAPAAASTACGGGCCTTECLGDGQQSWQPVLPHLLARSNTGLGTVLMFCLGVKHISSHPHHNLSK